MSFVGQSSDGVPHVVATVDRALAFPSAEFVRRALRKAADSTRAPLVLDASHVQAADFTAARVRSPLPLPMPASRTISAASTCIASYSYCTRETFLIRRLNAMKRYDTLCAFASDVKFTHNIQ